MDAIIKEKLSYHRDTLQMDINENKIRKDCEREARRGINSIMANYDQRTGTLMAKFVKQLTQTIYSKIVVNEDSLTKVRKICDARKGPVIFCPTHRSYVDFLLISVIMLYYDIEVPYVCSGDNLGKMPGISYLLRSSGAFFMRRTFREDPLYRAIFTEYMNQLVSDKAVFEFFPEGTRSRTNAMLPPKFGIIQILTDAFFRGNAEEVTFIPVTINYTRVLEDNSFPGELTGA